MKRRNFLKSVGVGLSSYLLGAPQVAAATRPNILFILIDDLGWNDVGYHGSEIQTPHIDRLAAEGLCLDHHYVAPTCSPTRAGLLTGRFPSRYGVLSPVNERVFEADAATLATALKRGGYDTSLTGKWHLGSRPEWGPNRHGFDYAYGSLAGGVHPYNHRYKVGPYSETWHRNGELIEEKGHVTDLIGREAVGRIEAGARSDAPFFLYVAFTAVHIPISEPEQWTAMYEGKIEDESRRRFAACASHMDHWIGEIVATLERTGQRDNTLIVFSSDNGAQETWATVGEYPGEDPSMESPILGFNRPLRGWKGELYEGGIRVPAFINQPGVIEPGVLDTPAHIVDWMPTLCARTSCPAPDEHWYDGVDIWPLIQGGDAPPRALYWRTASHHAIRHGDWKLIVSRDGTRELYDLTSDPAEEHNRAESLPERVTELEALLETHRARDKDEEVPFTRNPAPGAAGPS